MKSVPRRRVASKRKLKLRSARAITDELRYSLWNLSWQISTNMSHIARKIVSNETGSHCDEPTGSRSFAKCVINSWKFITYSWRVAAVLSFCKKIIQARFRGISVRSSRRWQNKISSARNICRFVCSPPMGEPLRFYGGKNCTKLNCFSNQALIPCII